MEQVFRSEAWSGQLNLREFARVLTKLGIDAIHAKALFYCFDQDGSGELDYREVFIGLSLVLAGSQRDRLRAAFAMIDTNASGRISQAELEIFLLTVAPASMPRRELSLIHI